MEDGGELHTGSRPDPVIGNENLQSDTVKKEIEKQRQQAQELLPIATTVGEFIQEEKAKIKDFHSYLGALLSRKGGKQPTPDEIAVEFRAREIYLASLERLEDLISSRILKLKTRQKKTEDEDGED